MADLPINAVDLGAGLTLLISACLAFSRVFVHEVLSMACWVGAIFATIYGFPYAKPYARAYIGMEIAADLAAGVAIFAVSMVLLSMLIRRISSKVQDSSLGAVDSSLGFLFGVARGAVLVCLVYIAADMLMPLDGQAANGEKDAAAEDEEPKDERPAWIKGSRSLPLIRQGAGVLSSLVPGGKTDKGAKSANGKAGGVAGEMFDAMKTFDKMISPAVKAPLPAAPDGGYGVKDRKNMGKAVEGVQ